MSFSFLELEQKNIVVYVNLVQTMLTVLIIKTYREISRALLEIKMEFCLPPFRAFYLECIDLITDSQAHLWVATPRWRSVLSWCWESMHTASISFTLLYLHDFLCSSPLSLSSSAAEVRPRRLEIRRKKTASPKSMAFLPWFWCECSIHATSSNNSYVCSWHMNTLKSAKHPLCKKAWLFGF